jgi:UDP-GlcNAc3NAcA epimerase
LQGSGEWGIGHRSRILEALGLRPKGYLLATVHRPYNTDDPAALREILTAFAEMDAPVVFVVHPRSQGRMAAFGLDKELDLQASGVRCIGPVGYLDMLMLEQQVRLPAPRAQIGPRRRGGVR